MLQVPILRFDGLDNQQQPQAYGVSRTPLFRMDAFA
jgi:hypothetical protein